VAGRRPLRRSTDAVETGRPLRGLHVSRLAGRPLSVMGMFAGRFPVCGVAIDLDDVLSIHASEPSTSLARPASRSPTPREALSHEVLNHDSREVMGGAQLVALQRTAHGWGRRAVARRRAVHRRDRACDGPRGVRGRHRLAKATNREARAREPGMLGPKPVRAPQA